MKHGLAKQNAGGAAIEYILVSLFALIVTLAGLHWIGQTLNAKIVEVNASSGLQLPELPNLSFWR